MSKLTRVLAAIVVAGLCLLPDPRVMAGSGGGYDLAWWSVDGGAAIAEAGRYRLVGTAGQPDASFLEGGSYRLTGGFLAGATFALELFLPLVLRQF